MDIELTKESRKVLKRIYDLYLERRKNGLSKDAATYFEAPASGGPEIEGMQDARSELARAGMITSYILGDFKLTDRAIIFLETFSPDDLLKWVDIGLQALSALSSFLLP